MEIRLKVRYALRKPALLADLMEHPGRGTPYSTRTLAEAAGCHHSQVHRLLNGKQDTVDMDLAHALADALGVAVLVLFMPPPSPDQTDATTS